MGSSCARSRAPRRGHRTFVIRGFGPLPGPSGCLGGVSRGFFALILGPSFDELEVGLRGCTASACLGRLLETLVFYEVFGGVRVWRPAGWCEGGRVLALRPPPPLRPTAATLVLAACQADLQPGALPPARLWPFRFVKHPFRFVKHKVFGVSVFGPPFWLPRATFKATMQKTSFRRDWRSVGGLSRPKWSWHSRGVHIFKMLVFSSQQVRPLCSQPSRLICSRGPSLQPPGCRFVS